LNRPHHALDVAIAIIGIHKTGEFGGFDNVADSGQHLGEAGEAQIRQCVPRRQERRAADIKSRRPGAFDQPC
jgi:hypothetical protein